ncbi:MAG: peptidylprolyl isomerase [Pseudomonadota bacterium]
MLSRLSQPFRRLSIRHFTPPVVAVALALILTAPTVMQPAYGQIEGIAAVVNDDMVSFTDVRDRLAIAISAAGLPDNEETRTRLQPQVMRVLVDEKLKLQEAARLEIEVTDEEITQELGVIAQRNNMNADQFLSMLQARGIAARSMEDQVRADLAWRKVVQSRLNRQVTISSEDVAMQREQLMQQQGQTSYLVQEIFLPVEDPADNAAVQALAQRLVDAIRQGAPFVAVAAQFSQGVGAAQGGNLGWVQAGQLAPELDALLPRIGLNRLSPPIRSEAGWHLLAIRNIREAANMENSTVDLKQLVFEPDPTIEPATRLAQAAQTAANIDSCDAMQALIDESPSSLSGDMGTVSIGDLNPVFQSAVGSLEPGMVSAPLELGELVALVMVCDREEGEMDLPDDETIRDNLSLERLDLLQRRYLRDLRAAAFIDQRTE